jgi:MFS family permease
VAGAGLGLASVAATTQGTAVPEALRGAASGIVNTAAQLGTAVGIAVLLLIAAATTGGERAGADHADGADRTDEASRTRAGPARVLVRAGPGLQTRATASVRVAGAVLRQDWRSR